MKKKKVFDDEESANRFAEKVNGIVRASYLPDYMSVIAIWIVEWEE